MGENILFNIINTYQRLLDDKFKPKKLEVDIIYDNKTLVIRCFEREILNSILKYHEQKYNISGFFRESLLGKIILLNVKEVKKIYKTLNFNDIYFYYKIEFCNRVKMIIDKYDIIFKIEPNQEYIQLKFDYEKVINKDSINIEDYYQIRKRFETLRNQEI